MDYFKVTVVMPVYNGAKYLHASIESILNQTFTDFEFVIINDGSTDCSVEIIKRYDDPRIILIQNDRNLGLVATRNKGLACARGEYIALLDCDDIAHTERLAEQVSFLDQNPDFGMLGSWIEMIDDNNQLTGEVMKYTASSEEIPVCLLFNNYFAQSALLIRRTALPPEGYDPTYIVAEDYDLWTRIVKTTKTWNLQKVLTSYRVHAKSISFDKADLLEKTARDIIANQLSSLRITPTYNEFNLHRDLGNQTFKISVQFLREAEGWLNKLREANIKYGIYSLVVFERYLGEKWFQICFDSTNLGWQAVQYFSISPLSELVKINALSKFKLYAKCLFNFRSKLNPYE